MTKVWSHKRKDNQKLYLKKSYHSQTVKHVDTKTSDNPKEQDLKEHSKTLTLDKLKYNIHETPE